MCSRQHSHTLKEISVTLGTSCTDQLVSAAVGLTLPRTTDLKLVWCLLVKLTKHIKRKLNSVSETGFGPSRKPRAACRGAADRAHLRTWGLGVIQRYSRCQKNVKHPREGVILLSVVTYKHVSFKTQHKFIIFFLNCQKFERTCRHFHNLNVLL